MKTKAIIFLLVLCSQTFAQMQLNEINLELIPYKKVRNYIVCQKDSLSDISELQPSWKIQTDTGYYHVQKDIFVIEDSLTKVWSNYRTTSPAESWNGKKVNFGVLVSKDDNEVVYPYGKCLIDGIKPGNIVYLNLKVLAGVRNLAMAFEVIAVDPVKKIIEFSYLEDNASKGKQILQFQAMNNGFTQIIHSSYFKSDSNMRDRMYPFFHKKLTTEFHNTMSLLIAGTDVLHIPVN